MKRSHTPGRSFLANAFLTASVLLLVTSCTITVNKSDDEDIPRDIEQVLMNQQSAWNEGDIRGFMKGYRASEETIFASGGNITYGWDAVLERYLDRYDSREKMGTLTFTIHRIDVLDDDLAKVLGGWNLELEGDDAGGLFTLIFRKFDDGWKVIHDHTSSRD